MVVTSNKTTLRYLNANVRFLSNTRIYWERRKNKHPVIQCRRCQRHGHATANCQRQPRCLKCAEEHWTSACINTRDTPAKCVNCLGAHPANYSGCPEYKKKVEAVDEKRTSAKQILKPAPLPAINPWAQRSAPSMSQIQKNADPTNYPPLPKSRREEESAANRPAARREATTTDTTDTTKDGVDIFTSISEEVNQLNHLVNLKGLLEAFKDLNYQLGTARNAQEKFTTFIQFVQGLDKYNI
nr:unnamed protein product [Callosobruchus analis]